jgi:hypothetical protein
MFQLFYIRASPPRGETAVRKPAKRSCAAAGARLRGGSTGCKPLSSDGGGGTFWKVRPPLRSEAGVVEPRWRAHNRSFSIVISFLAWISREYPISLGTGQEPFFLVFLKSCFDSLFSTNPLWIQKACTRLFYLFSDVLWPRFVSLFACMRSTI